MHGGDGDPLRHSARTSLHDDRREMTQTPRKALKTIGYIAILIGLYLVFSISLGLGLQVSPLYGNIGLGVTGVLVALYVYLGFIRGQSP